MITSREIKGPIVLRNTLDWFFQLQLNLDDYGGNAEEESYTMRCYVRGVIEGKQHTGGTVIGPNVVRGGTPAADNRTSASIELSVMAQTYYLNRSASPPGNGCLDLDYNFDMPVNWNEGLTFRLDGINNQLYEPRDPTSLAWFDTGLAGHREDPQFISVALEFFDGPLRVVAKDFVFSGFVDNARKGGQR